jgi:pyruvate dehydrogenase E1 component alpha subunit
MSDPQKYRTKDELEQYKEQDPIEDVRHTLLTNNMATEAELDAIDEKIKEIVAESVRFAEESPFPPADEVYKDIYVEPNYPFIVE